MHNSWFCLIRFRALIPASFNGFSPKNYLIYPTCLNIWWKQWLFLQLLLDWHFTVGGFYTIRRPLPEAVCAELLQSAEFSHGTKEALRRFCRTLPPPSIPNFYEPWVPWSSPDQHLHVVVFVYILGTLHHVLCCFTSVWKAIKYIPNYTNIKEEPY